MQHPNAPVAAIEIQVPGEAIEVGLIFKKIEQVVEAKAKLKTLKEQQQNILDKDYEYATTQTLIAERKEKLASEKNRVLNTPEAAAISINISEAKEELKELEESLGNHLEAYNAKTGKTVLEGNGKKVYLTKKVKLASGQLSLFQKENK